MVRSAAISGRMLFALAAAFAVAGAGCSLDYGASLSDTMGEGIPDTVMIGVTRTVVENGAPRQKMEADRLESYEALKKVKLTGIRFTEYSADGSGAVSTEGHADSAVFFTDTENAELSGDVNFYSAHDGVTVTSGFLKWDGQERVLGSRADTVTTLKDDDGSSLAGSGFSADAARRSFMFGNRADGSYVAPKKAE